MLDPPRDGIHPGALQKIIRYGVERLVYISCKPTSLVRDLEVFLGNGYAVRRAVAVDQFPWTSGIETVVMTLSHDCCISFCERFNRFIHTRDPGRKLNFLKGGSRTEGTDIFLNRPGK